MMNDMIRRPAEQFSPKSSPRGSRSPVVPRQDSSGTLKATISLGGKTPAITLVQHGPFYLTKDIPNESELTGATNLMAHHNLEHAYNKFCCGRKMKDQLSAFLPTVPGNIDAPGSADNSSLRLLIERPPIGNKELLPLTQQQLFGFRLHPGPPLPEKYRLMMNTPVRSKKHKHKKSKLKGPGDTPLHEGIAADGGLDAAAGGSARDDKKHKKQRRHDEDKERKKKKKEKKKKKQKHSPDSSVLSTGPHGSV